MKRLLCLVLALCLILPGCAVSKERLREPVTFYYPRRQYQYGVEDGVISSEQREAAGHRDDLSYLLALYLIGPSDEALVSPLPWGTRILKTTQKGTAVTLKLTDTALTMTDTEFSLACACLSMTCMGLANVENVTIVSGSRSLTISRDNLLLNDTVTPEETAK